jgi:PAS domain S-box-containing protein
MTRPRQDWTQMREGIIGLGEESSKRSYYPDLMARMAELEQAQAGLGRSEANLRTLFNSLPDAVIIHDRQGRVLEVNDAMLEMYGVSQATCRDYSLLDYSAHDAEDPVVAAQIRGHMAQMESEGRAVYQWQARRPLHPGEDFAVEVSLRRASWYGEDAVVAVVRDISERKRLEDRLNQSQRLESLGQLAGGVAHDTNNMLGVILGYAEILLENAPEGSALHRDLEQIRRASMSSADLIRKLLAFSRQQPSRPELVDLNLQVESTLLLLQRLLGEPYHIVWKPGERLGCVRIDPLQLEQLLTNLCLNARDAVQPGDAITIETAAVQVDEVYAKAHPEAYPGEFVTLTVSDTGIGMPPAIQARIFDPFFTTKAVGSGTGLGLATVYGIVRQNGGFITLYSLPGMGTTFRIHLPRQTRTAPNRDAAPEGLPATGSETVLLVEDEEALLELGARLLQSAGYQVLAALDPLEALHIAADASRPIDLLATDLVMPGLDGRQLCASLRLLRPGLRVLYLSGFPAGIASSEDLVGRGADFLQKPFTRRGLLQKVREILNRVDSKNNTLT